MIQSAAAPNSANTAQPLTRKWLSRLATFILRVRLTRAALCTTLILALAYFFNARAGGIDSVETVDFGTLRGQVSLRDAQSITLKSESGEQLLALQDVIRINLAAEQQVPQAPWPAILLSTSDVLRGRIAGSDQHHIIVQSPSFGEVLTPIRWISVVLFDVSAPAGTADALRQAAREKDVVLLQNGERLEGIVAEISPERVLFRAAPGELEIPLARVVGVAFAHTQTSPPAEELQVCVSTIDGSVLTGRIQPADEPGRFVLETTWASLPVSMHESVCSIEIRGGRLLYLSDLDPVEVEQVPHLGRLWPWQRDRSVGGTPLSIRGKVYRKGLGVHSRSRLAYDLNGLFRRFRTEIGIDDATAHIGQATFTILADGRVLFSRENLAGDDEPVQVDVDTTGVQRLELLVDYGMGLDVGDHANWAEARLERAREN